MFKDGKEIQEYVSENIRMSTKQKCWIYKKDYMECSREEVEELKQFCNLSGIEISESKLDDRAIIQFSRAG